MAKPNYSYEKRQRELAKKKKKEEKEKEKAARKSTPLSGSDSGSMPDEGGAVPVNMPAGGESTTP